MHKRKFEKNFLDSHKLPQAHEKVCDENESRIRKKNDRRKQFISCIRRTGEKDLNQL